MQTFHANHRSSHWVPLGLDLGRKLHLLPLRVDPVRLLDEQAPADSLEVLVARLVAALLRRLEDADRLLLAQHVERVVVVARRDQDLDEVFVQALGEGPVHIPVERDHAAERGHRVAGKGLLVRDAEPLGGGHAAGVVVLDDHARRRLELVEQAPRGVEVEDVVERERAAVELAHPERTCVRPPTST